jgi:hypothetical protein
MEFDIKVQNLSSYDLLLNWAATSTKEVDMTKELLEKFSTDVYQQ